MRKEDRYDSLFRFYLDEKKHRVPWLWAKAQACAESGMNPQAVSHCGAQGLLQFMPATWAEVMGPQRDAFNPELSIQAYSIYSHWILDALGTEDLDKMCAAYNWGLGHVQRAGEQWRDKLPEETYNYISRVRVFYANLTGAAA